jgi:hypothetical protein
VEVLGVGEQPGLFDKVKDRPRGSWIPQSSPRDSPPDEVFPFRWKSLR